jgi:serine phosphatase RsbU (regulator of sigma subunit)/CheY-like chemotaxis protein
MNTDLLFAEEEGTQIELQSVQPSMYRILLVDDEKEVHQVTRLALSKFKFEGHRVDIISAYSADQAMRMLREDDSYAMIFLDVVMESEDAGLRVVNFIRNDLGNRIVRIILRTGQPGVAPEEFVINNYDIDDYKSKSELTSLKLQTSVISSLRAYRELRRIEDIVKERTAELAERNKEIQDSMRYARRIQSAIFPDVSTVRLFFPQSFIFLKPKEAVSGDFYWLSHHEQYTLIANIDCTGHGIPGALMSIIGYNLLSRIIDDYGIRKPNEILAALDIQMREMLGSEVAEGQASVTSINCVRDGMDLAFCLIDHQNKCMQFAGANRPIYLIKGQQIREYTGDRNPVGDYLIENKIYTNQEISYEPGERLYLFSDGFIDQFGGDQGRKYTYKRFKEFLLSIQMLPMEIQEKAVKDEFEAWKGNYKQIDDVTLIGIELS